ncbi:MAG: enoyl-CoA hydratase [Pseudomonadota bacterium]
MLKSDLTASGILSLTLASPPANALSEAMIAAIKSAVENAGDNIRVIVIGAEGKVFSAGHDIKEMTAHRNDPDRGRAYFDKVMTACGEMMQTVVRSPKPVIARVGTLATAAGCQLVASCDLAIASSEARFCTPGVNIGLFCSTPMVALSRTMGRKHALEMLLLGDEVSAERAREFGLINEVVPPEDLDRRTMEIAEKIASKSRHVVKIGKEAFQNQFEMPLDEAYQYCANVMAENMMARDAEEGLAAVLEKRKPVWEDR